MVKTDYIQKLFAERIGGSDFGVKTSDFKFEKIKKAKREAIEAHPESELIDMGIGEPDSMAAQPIVNTLAEESQKPENRFYSDNGIDKFKQAAADYMKNVFDASDLQPETEINHTIGVKSALSMLPKAFIKDRKSVV